MRDYLIIGHGLAGALLAEELIEARKSFHVVNTQKDNSASNIAAGIYNPITGRKMTKTWMADELFPMLESYYSVLEDKLNTSFLNHIGIYRPFFSIEQQNDWSVNPKSEFDSFVSKVSNKSHPSLKYNDPHGGVYLKNAGYINVKDLLTAHKRYLLDKGCYEEMVFQESLLKLDGNQLIFDGKKYNRLVFCLGHGQLSAPFFNWLPFKPVKGEILEVEMDVDTETIVNRGVFMVPIGGRMYRVGATYNWKEIDEKTTESGKSALLEKLQSIYNGKFKVLNSVAGIRPASKDRKPFIGQHPVDRQVYVFNGFGSKGVSMIPYFAKNFVSYLEQGTSFPEEANISRYFSLME